MKFAAPTPLDYFATLVAEDDSLNLLEAAVSLAQDDHPQLDVQAVLAQVDGLARRLRDRLASETPPPERLRLLARFFHGELGFAGNLNNYYAADNSFVHRVLETRRRGRRPSRPDARSGSRDGSSTPSASRRRCARAARRPRPRRGSAPVRSGSSHAPRCAHRCRARGPRAPVRSPLRRERMRPPRPAGRVQHPPAE